MDAKNISVIDTYTVATPAQRIMAGFIDLVVYAILTVTFTLVFGLFGLSQIGELIGLFYLFFRDSLNALNYQSIGKKIIGLKVIHKDETQVTYLKGFKRNFVFLPNLLNLAGISFLYIGSGFTLLLALIELFQLFNNDDYQRLGDRFANTMVIQQEKND